MLINLIGHVFQLPVLRHLDGLTAAGLGLLRGALLLYVLFLLVPLVRAVIPVAALDAYLESSMLSPVFSSTGFFNRVITGL